MSLAQPPVAELRGRPPLLVQGLASLLLGGALLGLAAVGELPLLAGVVALQLLVVLGFLALVDAPASAGIFGLAAGAAVAADVVVTVADGEVDGLAGVVALSLVAALLHQLSRRERSRVTESLADTLVAVVLVAAAACLPAALQLDQWPVRAALAGGAAALAVGRLADRLLRRPVLSPGASRAWPGLVLALVAGAGAATVVTDGFLGRGEAALVGLAAAATVAALDLAVDLAAMEISPATPAAGTDAQPSPHLSRRAAALRPVSLVLPFALLGPVALLAVRLLE